MADYKEVGALNLLEHYPGEDGFVEGQVITVILVANVAFVYDFEQSSNVYIC
jgi:hypothetical protein